MFSVFKRIRISLSLCVLLAGVLIVFGLQVRTAGRSPHASNAQSGTYAARSEGKEEKQQDKLLAALMVLACCRPAYLRRALESIERAGRDPVQFPEFVAIDGEDQQVIGVAKEKAGEGGVLVHSRRGELAEARRGGSYGLIATHYKWALEEIFEVMGYERVLVVEDDVEVSPDFFALFEATAPLLDDDPSLMCVSAYNDHGQIPGDPFAFHRTDIFPGTGWMMTRRTSREINRHGWPDAYFYEWLRVPENRHLMQCLRPEVSRCRRYGVQGVSHGQFARQVTAVRLQAGKVDFASHLNLSSLRPLNYDRWLRTALEQSSLSHSIPSNPIPGTSYALPYSSEASFRRIANRLGIMPDFKLGVPRASFRGVVPLRHPSSLSSFLFLFPSTEPNMPQPMLAPPLPSPRSEQGIPK